MSDENGNGDEEKSQDGVSEEALGRSYIADTPDEDPRVEATGASVKSDGDGSNGDEEASESGDE